jgi:two-component system OmpR family response regulator
MLPELDGLEVLKRIRARDDTPVIVLTAKQEPADRVVGLDAGADDYVAKPFHFPELVARIRAVLRRGGQAEHDAIDVGDLSIDVTAHEVTRGGRRIALTAKQFELLTYLARHARRVLSKREIYENVWGWSYVNDANLIEQHVSNLRERVDNGASRPLIHTVRGVGYVLRDGGS